MDEAESGGLRKGLEVVRDVGEAVDAAVGDGVAGVGAR